MARRKHVLGLILGVIFVLVLFGRPSQWTRRDDEAGYAAVNVVESIAKRDQTATSQLFGRELSTGEMNELTTVVPPELLDPDFPRVRVTDGITWFDAKAATASVRNVVENSTPTIEVTMTWDRTRSEWKVVSVSRR